MAAARPHRKARLLPTSALHWTCPRGWIPKAPRRSGGDALSTLIGQERAIDALRLALDVDAPGYNLFITGLESDAKLNTVRSLLDPLRLRCPLLQDHVFVHNFEDPVRPHHLALPAGQGKALSAAMEHWCHALQREIPHLLGSEEHLERRNRLFRRYTVAEDQLFRRLARRARTAGLALVQVEDEEGKHPDIYPVVEEQAIPLEELAALPEDERPDEGTIRRLAVAREGLLDQLRKARHKARQLGLRLLREAQDLDENAVRELVEGVTVATAEELEADETLAAWLGECAGAALAHLNLFRSTAGGGEGSKDDEDGSDPSSLGLEIFEVNLVRSAVEGSCPIVFEDHPNYSNLFGTVERHRLRSGPGHFHLAIRPGSLLAADGGLLVLNARDVFQEAEVWRALKRTLQNQQLQVHAIEGISPLGVTGVRPEAIPIDLKVVLVGDNGLFEALHESDFDFPKIFKVKAEFDDNLPLDPRNVGRLVRVLRELGRRENLLPFSITGLQALVERAVADAGRRNRISVRVPRLMDYAREASHYARRERKRRIDRGTVESARRHFVAQHSVEAEWYQRAVLDGIYDIRCQGTRVGSVNALTVISLGPLSFGRVARVSASVALGDDSTVNVERESDLSGPIHNKGVLLLESFLRSRFGQARTLPIKAAITFDQSYGPVDGDSASSTEVYALLSAIGELPVRQDIAVTGAVSMKGEILAVGGVAHKIRSFFTLCRDRGFTGTQGVALPATNVEDLMLDEEILREVRAGNFHIWALETIDQGIELLTGIPAGRRRKKKGNWTPDSVMDRVQKALDRYEEAQRKEGKEHEKDREGKKKGRRGAEAEG